MIDPASIKCDRELWASSDPASITGNGSKDSPMRTGGNFDLLMPVIGQSCRLHLYPGIYSTTQWNNPATFILDDGGRGGVTIRQADNSPGRSGPHIRMFGSADQWSRYFMMSGITLDGNWKNQAGSRTGNFKLEPLAVQTIIGQYSNCRITNWGCASGDYQVNNKLEAFPLRFDTFASGDTALYDPRYQAQKTSEPWPTRVEILDCVVDPGIFVGGGYATELFFQTAQGFVSTPQGPAPVDRQPFGTRTTEAALARGNRLSCPGGIAMGAGGLRGGGVEQVTFENNDVFDTKCGVNIDTGRLSKVTLRNNRFINVSQGPNITPDGNGDGLEIVGNTIHIGDPFLNTILGRNELQWGVNVANTTAAVGRKNIIFLPSGIPITSGMILWTDQGNVVVPIGSTQTDQSTNLARISDLETSVRSLTAKNASLVKAIQDARTVLAQSL